jgi:hypothetical protein
MAFVTAANVGVASAQVKLRRHEIEPPPIGAKLLVAEIAGWLSGSPRCRLAAASSLPSMPTWRGSSAFGGPNETARRSPAARRDVERNVHRATAPGRRPASTSGAGSWSRRSRGRAVRCAQTRGALDCATAIPGRNSTNPANTRYCRMMRPRWQEARPAAMHGITLARTAPAAKGADIWGETLNGKARTFCCRR